MDPDVYLDNAATTPLAPEVRAAMRPFLEEEFGNPSSRHHLGVRAAEAVEEARRAVAAATGARATSVVFTSGGTEANNLGILGQARARRKHGRHVLLGPTEHACVRGAAQALANEGFEVEWSTLARDGSLNVEDFAARLRADTVLVAQMLVQNEFGSVYPIARIARLLHTRAANAVLHVDAVQALGKVEISLPTLGAHSLAISAHKAHGPKGAGALVLGGDAANAAITPLVFGGGQESKVRPGTENVAAIVGFGAAARLAEERREAATAHVGRLRAILVEGLESTPVGGGARVLVPGTPEQPTVPAIVAVLLPGAPAEVRMHHLEEQGILVSAGSACQARKPESSPALLALGLSHEDARAVLRFSFSRENTVADVERAVAALGRVCRKLESARR